MTVEIWANEIEKEIKSLVMKQIGPNVTLESIKTKSFKPEQKSGIRLRYLDREITVIGLRLRRFDKEGDLVQIVVFLKEKNIDQGSGFTMFKNEVLRLAVDWLLGKSYQEVYSQCKYLGGNSRLKDQLIEEIVKRNSFFKDILDGREGFMKGARKCKFAINQYALRKEVDFYYRGIKVFKAGVEDIERLFMLMENWLIDRWSARKIQELYSEVDIRHSDLFNWWWLFGKKKIENIKSWDEIENYYLDSFKSDPTIRLFIEKLRSNQFDRKTKAGRVLSRLIISKPILKGFKKRNKVIAFDFAYSEPRLTIITSDGRKTLFNNVECNEKVMDECKFVLK